jgi:hypothetical protein
MSKLLKDAFAKVRQLPEDVQDRAAQQLMDYLEDEIPSLGDRAAITEGREAYARGDFVSLDQWRHEMGLDNH